MDSDPVDPGAGRTLNLLTRDAVIEHVVAGAADPCSHNAFIVDLLAMTVWHSVVVRMVIVEMIPRNKTVATCGQTKSETHTHMGSHRAANLL